jgi:type I restriction enzyme S subunit
MVILKGFSDIVAPWFSKLRANSEQSRTLAALRDTLLPKLLSGAVAVGAEGVV